MVVDLTVLKERTGVHSSLVVPLHNRYHMLGKRITDGQLTNRAFLYDDLKNKHYE